MAVSAEVAGQVSTNNFASKVALVARFFTNIRIDLFYGSRGFNLVRRAVRRLARQEVRVPNSAQLVRLQDFRVQGDHSRD
jgi:hypothetical protein